MSRLPTLYMPHGGGPCFFMDWDPPHAWDRMADYLRAIPGQVGQKPTAILLVSAHWEEAQITIQTNPAPPLLFDYYGFPDATYQLEYPAPGSPALADQVAALLAQAGIAHDQNAERGFDHATFVPLKLAFPAADIPIVQLSLQTDLDPAAHIAFGEALQPLRDDGILIIASGMSYHNMDDFRANRRHQGTAIPSSAQFDDWLAHSLTQCPAQQRRTALIDWAAAPAARQAHPREEHLIPLHVAVGAAGSDPGRQTLKDTVLGAAVSAYQFG